MNNSLAKNKKVSTLPVISSFANELLCNACLRRESNAPVQAIIKKNSQSLLKRQIKETKEEIKKVMSRVNQIYSSLVQNEIQTFPDDVSLPSFEYISDINQLESILKDQVKKQLYQNQVTVFIVGHTAICEQKLKLINQLNEFFLMNSKLFIDEAWEEQINTDVDIDTVSDNVKDSLTSAAVLSNRLSEINKEMVQYFTEQATASAAHLKFKGKKKLEKSLQQAKDEIIGLQEKIKQITTDLGKKEEQIDDLTKQFETKKKECQEFKVVAAMNHLYLENIQALDKEVKEKNSQISDLQCKVDNLESNINNLKLSQVPSKLDSLIKQNEEIIFELMEKLENDLVDEDEVLEAADNLHMLQIQDLSVNHREEIVQLEMNHKKSLLQLTEAKGSHKEGSQKGTSTKKSKSVTKQKSKGDSKTGKSSKNKDVKENTDSTQASGAGAKEKGDSTAKTTKTQSKLSKTVKQAPVETIVDHSVLETLEVFDLTDNEAWAGLPSEQIPERFIQYRWLTTKKLKELDEQLKLMTLRTQRKVESLKSQFQEHKIKWEEERDLLKQQVVQLKGLQVAAEKEADAVMTQLEDFINEQEKMDTQENIDCLNVGEESEHTENAESKILDLPSEIYQEDLHTALPEAKEMVTTTTCVSDAPAILVENSSTAESHTSKVPEPVILPDQKSAIPSAPDLSTNEGNEIQPEEDPCPKRKDSKMEAAGMPFQHPQELQGINEDVIGDGDKNLPEVSQNNDTEDSIKIDADSTVNNQMYKIIIQFKENLTKLISHKDMKNTQEILVDIDSIIKEDNMNKDREIHSDELFKHIQQTFKDITHLVYDQFQQQQVQQLTNEKGYPSLDSENLPTDNQRQNLSSMTSEKSTSPNKIAMRELMDLYNQLQCQIIEDTQKHEAEQRQNSLVMIKMQDQITSLQEQLELARKIQMDSTKQYPPYNHPVMFTRLDLERNAKIMTRAVASQHITDERYKDIVQQMAKYISLPVLRFQQLVHRYVHHCRLKHIYGYIKHQSQINYLRGGANIKEAYQLQKVANIHNQYVNHWCEQATVMSMERQSQANALTETLEDLEAESGLFLIKPIYTNRIKLISREKKVQKKRNKVASNPSHLKQMSTANSADTVFDPNSKINIALNSCNFQPQRLKDESNNFLSPNCNKQRHASTPIWASSFQSNLTKTEEDQYIHDSIPKETTTTATSVIAYGSMLTAPRILELDINRMLIGQNNVSIQINPPTADESQQLNLRSYISVCRPTAIPRNSCSAQPFSNITSSCYELKTPPVSRLCTPKPNNGEQFVQADQLPSKLQLEKISFPPISSHVTTQTSVGHDNYLTSK